VSAPARRPLRIRLCDGIIRENDILLDALRHHYEPVESDDPEIVFFGDGLNPEYVRYDCKRVNFSVENKWPDYSQCDYSLSFRDSADPRNLRQPYYTQEVRPAALVKDAGFAERVLAEERDFCGFLVSNGNPRRTWNRVEFFQRLHARRRVNSGGRAYNNIGGEPVKDRRAFVARHRFYIAFENQSWPGYITEKIACAMQDGAIPIYWGDPAVVKEFNPKSFVNVHDFRDMDAAIDHVLRLADDREALRAMLAEPWFHDNRPNKYYDTLRLGAFLHRIVEEPQRPRPRYYPQARLWYFRKKIMTRYPKLFAPSGGM